MKIFITIFSLLLFASAASAQSAKPISKYTSLLASDCKEDKGELEDGLIYQASCKGVGGYSIASFGTEHTSTFDLVGADGKELGLNIRSFIPSAAPSSTGTKVEWRTVQKGNRLEANALIARINVFADPNDAARATSYLVVLKLAGANSCVVGLIEPSKAQNAAARKMADKADTMQCLSPEN